MPDPNQPPLPNPGQPQQLLDANAALAAKATGAASGAQASGAAAPHPSLLGGAGTGAQTGAAASGLPAPSLLGGAGSGVATGALQGALPPPSLLGGAGAGQTTSTGALPPIQSNKILGMTPDEVRANYAAAPAVMYKLLATLAMEQLRDRVDPQRQWPSARWNAYIDRIVPASVSSTYDTVQAYKQLYEALQPTVDNPPPEKATQQSVEYFPLLAGLIPDAVGGSAYDDLLAQSEQLLSSTGSDQYATISALATSQQDQLIATQQITPPPSDPCDPSASYPCSSCDMPPDQQAGTMLEGCSTQLCQLQSQIISWLTAQLGQCQGNIVALAQAVIAKLSPTVNQASDNYSALTQQISQWLTTTLSVVEEQAYALASLTGAPPVVPCDPTQGPCPPPQQTATSPPIPPLPPDDDKSITSTPAEGGTVGGEPTGQPQEESEEELDPALTAMPEPRQDQAVLEQVAPFNAAELATDQLAVVIERLRGVGRQLLSGAFGTLKMRNELFTDALVSVLTYGEKPERMARIIGDLEIQRTDLANWAREYYSSYDLITGQSSDGLRYLLAVRALCDALVTASWHMTQTAGYTASHSFNDTASGGGSIGGNVGLPKGSPIGGGVNAQAGSYTQRTDGTGNTQAEIGSLSWTLRAVVVPLIDLLDRAIAAEVPTRYLDASSALECYLSGRIPLVTLRFFVKLSGQPWSTFAPLVYARRQRLSATDIVAYWRRGVITDQQRERMLRDNGWIMEEDRSRLVSLSDSWPSSGDVIRMAAEGVYDAAAIGPMDLESGFAARYTGDLSTWGRAAGLSDPIARAYWRAHWATMPSGTLNEMLHRLRPGRVDAAIVTTQEDVDRELSRGTIHPYWRDRLKAIAYTLPPRRILLQSYTAGGLSRAELVETLQDYGYSAVNAERQARVMDAQRIDAIVKHRFAQGYIRHGYSIDTARGLLVSAGYDPDAVDVALTQATALQQAMLTEEAVRDLRGQYRQGRIDIGTLQIRLLALGLDTDQAQRLISAWFAEGQRPVKEESASQLCKWYSDGLLSGADMVTELVSLGYSTQVADLIARDCEVQRQHRIATQLEQLQRRNESAKEKADRTAKTAAREALAKRQQADLAARSALKDVQRRRQGLLIAAQRYAARYKVGVDEAGQALAAQVDRVCAAGQLGRIECERVVIRATYGVDKKGTTDFASLVDRAVESYVAGAGAVGPPVTVDVDGKVVPA